MTDWAFFKSLWYLIHFFCLCFLFLVHCWYRSWQQVPPHNSSHVSVARDKSSDTVGANLNAHDTQHRVTDRCRVTVRAEQVHSFISHIVLHIYLPVNCKMPSCQATHITSVQSLKHELHHPSWCYLIYVAVDNTTCEVWIYFYDFSIAEEKNNVTLAISSE